MARKPKNNLTRKEQKSRAEAAEQDALVREVDDAVRQSDFESFMGSYGKPLLGALILGLAGFGGYLYWDHQNEAALERQSETLIMALDQLEAGNRAEALGKLDEVDGKGAPTISAKMLRAGIAAEDGKTQEAAKLFGEVAADSTAPQIIRDMAILRRVNVLYDTMKPADIVTTLKPLAVPGKPLFASAGEVLAHTYLAQNKREEAGALFAQIARDENTPDGMRARVRNMAGVLGVDAVDNVQELLAEQRVNPEDTAATAASAANE